MQESRKLQEQVFHDTIRGAGANDPAQWANSKFYTIGRANHAHARNWLAQHSKGNRVLDYCCGNGETALFAAASGAVEVVGIDISPESVANAQKSARERGLDGIARFEVMDAENMTFPTASFDVISVGGVLHHLDLDAAYGELARVLAPGGQVQCIEGLRHNIAIHMYRKMTPHLRTPWEVDHILGRKQVEQARRYFGSVRPEKFFHLTTLAAVPFRNTPLFSPILSVGEAIDSVLLRIPGFQWQAWQLIFTLSDPKHESTK